jgi:phosphatidylserine decarboxylase
MLSLVPKNLISFLVGAFVQMRFPDSVAKWLREKFVSAFKIDMSEAAHSLDHYYTIEDVFTRGLKEGARTISGKVVSPADGFLAHSIPSRGDRSLQVKGTYYSLEELVFGLQGVGARKFDPAWATTVYLAPHNYHRVHSPIAGTLKAIRYIPGELWPVNKPFVKAVPRLFARNERLVFEFEDECGCLIDVVMVGALNVGRMVTPFLPRFAANSFNRQLDGRPKDFEMPHGCKVAAGEEIGTFLLGSTVVIVFDKKFVETFPLRQLAEGNLPVRMGDSLLGETP